MNLKGFEKAIAAIKAARKPNPIPESDYAMVKIVTKSRREYSGAYFGHADGTVELRPIVDQSQPRFIDIDDISSVERW